MSYQATGLHNLPLEDEAAVAAWLRMRERAERLAAANVSWLIPHQNKLIPITAAEVAHFVIQGKTVQLSTFSGQRYNVAFKLEALQAQVDSCQFFRANRQVLISRASLVELEHHSDRRMLVHVNPAASLQIFIPRVRIKEFKAWLKNA
jgi:two-component system response regulator LytT